MTAQLLPFPGTKEPHANKIAAYPLRFEPLYRRKLWGGRRLANLLREPLPGGPIGEAWVLSDREGHASRVSNGAWKGQTLTSLLQQFPDELMGKLAHRFHRFPLLLKFLDAAEMVSVQVHPSDAQTDLLTAGESGKTEAWVILEAGKDSRVYAGLKPGTTLSDLKKALTKGTAVEHLRCLNPKPGDVLLIPAGTVHTFGDLVLFEVQQNSDITFRLYDWDRVDEETGQPRALQVERGLACIDWAESAAGIATPRIAAANHARREILVQCDHFSLWRLRGQSPFTVGEEGAPRVLVCLDGAGQIVHGGVTHPVAKGNVFLLPAAIGTCAFQPRGGVTLLEIAIPDSDAE